MPEKKKFLFVCIENSNRSQMAEAFAKIYGGTDVEGYSAGSRPSGKVNPKAIGELPPLDVNGKSLKVNVAPMSIVRVDVKM